MIRRPLIRRVPIAVRAGAAAGLIASAVMVVRFRSGESPTHPDPPANHPAAPGSAGSSGLPVRYSAPADDGRRRPPRAAVAISAGDAADDRQAPASGARTVVLSESELRRRAATVETAANHELQRLVRILDLDTAQQDRIFSLLARRDPMWHSEMQTVTAVAGPGGELLYNTVTDAETPGPVPPVPPAGEPVGVSADDSVRVPADDIYDALDPEQRVALATEELERVEWWQDVIDRILPGGEIPAIDPPNADPPASRPPAIKEFYGEDVIVE